MKAIVLQPNLKHAIGVVSHAVAGTTTLPIIQMIAMTAKGGYFELWGTDLGIGIRYGIGAVIEEEGGICLPSKLLSDYIGGLPDQNIHMTTDEKRQSVAITCGSNDANISGVGADQFPFFPVVSEAERPAFSLEADWLRQTADGVAIAAADDIQRTTGAVCFRVQAGRVTVIAADGFRMARLTFKTEIPDQEILIPRSTLETLGRLLKDYPGMVEVYMRPDGPGGSASMSFVIGEVELYCRPMVGTYFNVEQVIPKDVMASTEFDTAELARAVKLASFYAKQNNQIVRLTLEGDTIMLGANAEEVGGNRTMVSADCEGGGFAAVNVKYMADAVAALGTERGKLAISPTRVIMLRPIGRDHYLHVIMPMNPKAGAPKEA
jgi:DNA polymerase-3 subunit beta